MRLLAVMMIVSIYSNLEGQNREVMYNKVFSNLVEENQDLFHWESMIIDNFGHFFRSYYYAYKSAIFAQIFFFTDMYTIIYHF